MKNQLSNKGKTMKPIKYNMTLNALTNLLINGAAMVFGRKAILTNEMAVEVELTKSDDFMFIDLGIRPVLNNTNSETFAVEILEDDLVTPMVLYVTSLVSCPLDGAQEPYAKTILDKQYPSVEKESVTDGIPLLGVSRAHLKEYLHKDTLGNFVVKRVLFDLLMGQDDAYLALSNLAKTDSGKQVVVIEKDECNELHILMGWIQSVSGIKAIGSYDGKSFVMDVEPTSSYGENKTLRSINVVPMLNTHGLTDTYIGEFKTTEEFLELLSNN